MAGLRSDDVYSHNYVPPSENEPDVLPGGRPTRPLPRTSEFEKGFERGSAGLRADTAGAVEALGTATGSQQLVEAGAAGHEQNTQEASAIPPGATESVFDIDSVESFLDWAAHGLGVLAPSALAMAGGAAAGAAVGGPVGALVGAASRFAIAGAGIGGFAGSAVPSTGAAFKEMQAEGVSRPGMAALEGGIIGLLDVAPQAHLLKVLGKTVPQKGVLRGVARGIADQAPKEALTEVAQEGVSEGFRQGLLPDYENPNLFRELVEAGSLGALGGGFAGGVGGGVRGALQQEATPSLPAPGLAASSDLDAYNEMQVGDFTPDELDAMGAPPAVEQELGFDPQQLQLDVPATKTQRRTAEARELLGQQPDNFPGNLNDQLEVLNRPFVTEQQTAFEQSKTEDIPQLQAGLESLKESLLDRKQTDILDVEADGDIGSLDIPASLSRFVVPERAGEKVTVRQMFDRIESASSKLKDSSARGIAVTPQTFTGPFERETLLQRSERRAQDLYPGDIDLQKTHVIQEANQLFVDKADQAELDRLYDPANPSKFLSYFEGIKSPPLSEVRLRLESGQLDPDTHTQFQKILDINKDESIGPSLKGVNLGRVGQKIFFKANQNFDVNKFPSMVRIGDGILNLRTLTNFARKERQKEEQVHKGSEKPLESHGSDTAAKRLVNDVMLGLELAADEGLIQFPEGTDPNVQAIMAPGALRKMVEHGDTQQRIQAQQSLNKLVGLIGPNTIVEGDNKTGTTFRDALAAAGIAKKFKKSRDRLGLVEITADEDVRDTTDGESVEPVFIQEQQEEDAARKRLQNESVLKTTNFKGISYTYPRIDFAEVKIPNGVVLSPAQANAVLKKKRPFELRGAGNSAAVVQATGKTRTLSHTATQEEVDAFADLVGVELGVVDAMFDKNDTLVGVQIKTVKPAAKTPAAPKAVEPKLPPHSDMRENIADITRQILSSPDKTKRFQLEKDLHKQKMQLKKAEKAEAKKYLDNPGPKASSSITQTFTNTKELLDNDNPYAEKIATEYFSRIKAPQNIYLMSSGQASKYLLKQAKLEWLANLATGTLHGFSTPVINGRIGVYVRPGLSATLTREVLAHEVGHAVYGAYAHTLNDSMANKIMKEYLAWRKKYGKDSTTIEELLRSKKQPKSVILTLTGQNGKVSLDQLNDPLRDYLLDFDEWFADSVSRWFTETRQPATGIQRFFKAIADTLLRMVGISPKGNINSLMDAIAGGRRTWDFPFSPQTGMAAAQSLPIPGDMVELIKKLAPKAKMKDIMSKVDAADIMYVATLEDQDPYGHAFHNAFAAYLMDERVGPATTNVIFNASRTKYVQNQMRTLFQHDRTALEQLDDPFSSAAYMYQLWKAGLINLGARTDNIFQRIAKFFRDVLGIVAESERASNLFQAIERSTEPFDTAVQRSAVARILPDSLAENIIKSFQPSYELAMKPVRSVFLTIDNRIHAFGIPALSEVANQFHNRPGEFFGNPTLQAQKQGFIGRFENRMRRIFDSKDAQFGNEALDYLYGSKPLSEAKPGVQRVVKQVRGLFVEMRKYQGEAGVDTKQTIKDYFPWMLNQDALSSKTDEFRAVLAQDKYKSKREDLAAFMNFRQHSWWMIKEYEGLGEKTLETAFKKLAKTGEWDLSYRDDETGVTIRVHSPPENTLDRDSMVEYMISSAMAEGSMDFSVSEDRQVPVMRFNNPRLFKFVEPAEMRPFLNNDLGEVTGLYISQAVKHAEYTRRFGEGGQGLASLLNQAEGQGATPIQIKTAVNYVKASMGTYGRHTAEWLHKYAGIALPEHQFSPINEGLNKAMGVAIVYQNLRYLALSTLTSLTDVMGIAVRSSEMGSIVRATKAFMQRNKNELNDLGEMLGIIEHSQVSDALGWRYDGMHLTGKLRRFNDGFFRVIGLQAWTRTTRLMGLAAAEAFIVKHSQRPGKHSQRWMNELNLTNDDIKLRKDGTLRVFSHAERLTASKTEVARDDRVRAALIQWTDEAILRPNPSMRTLWGSDPHFQLFQYLKSFMYTFHERILKRVGHELMEGNYAVMIGLLSYVPAMIAADLLRELIQYGGEGDPRKSNWGAGDYITHGAIRGGLLGYTQQGLDIHKDLKWGGYGVSGMAATFDTIASIPNLITMQPGAVIKALPGQTIYSKWFQ